MVSGYIKAGTDGNPFTGVITAALIGGTASVLGGGKFANGAATSAMQYAFNELTIDHLSANDAERESLIRQIDDELQVIKDALASDSPAEYGAAFYDGINPYDNDLARLKLQGLAINLSDLRLALRGQNIVNLISDSPHQISVGKRGIDWLGTGINVLSNVTRTQIESRRVNAYINCHGSGGCKLYAE